MSKTPEHFMSRAQTSKAMYNIGSTYITWSHGLTSITLIVNTMIMMNIFCTVERLNNQIYLDHTHVNILS